MRSTYESDIAHPWKPTKAQLLVAQNERVSDLVAPKTSSFSSPASTPAFTQLRSAVTLAAPATASGPPSTATASPLAFFSPLESSLLLDLNFGITNIVDRATARADELTDDELHAGGQRRKAKVKRWRPTVVAFVGIGPYRIVSSMKDARAGLRKASLSGSHAWVLPNPSGLNAHYQPASLGQLFGDLRLWAIAQHGHR